jgi:alginate O-acetyltransferase complex protein AlgJ
MRHLLKYLTLEQIPLILIFLVLLSPLALSPLYLFGDVGRKVLKSLEGNPLIGTQNVVVVDFTLSNWWSGNLHKEAEAWLNQEIPLRSNMVRATNQVYYSLFSKSYMSKGTLIIGKNKQIYVSSFIGKYCTNIAWGSSVYQHHSLSDIDQWSDQIKEVADFFERRGQTFIYLITPSKAAYYPEFIPDQFYCNPVSPRSNEQMVTAALLKRNVPYVDTSQTILEEKGKYPVELFPQTGLHWNDLGASLASREIMDQISRVTHYSLPQLKFSYSIQSQPLGDDLDLLNLLNLWNPEDKLLTPKVNISENQSTPLRLAFVGGSFVHSLNKIIGQSKTFCRIDHYFYYSLSYFSYPRQGLNPCGSPDLPNSQQNLLAANIVILEENSENIRSKHFELLRQFVMSHK